MNKFKFSGQLNRDRISSSLVTLKILTGVPDVKLDEECQARPFLDSSQLMKNIKIIST